MPLYKTICDQLNHAGFQFTKDTLRNFDIIEYMVLEAVGALHPLKDKPLLSVFRLGHTSNCLFEDSQKRSSLEFGFKKNSSDSGQSAISEEDGFDLIDKVKAIEVKFPKSTHDSEHFYYNHFNTLYAVIMLDDDIEKAIRSSSVFLAAGDLSQFDLGSLLLLRKKLACYQIADANIKALSIDLSDRITDYMNSHFDRQLIAQTEPEAQKQFNLMIAITKEEHRFNQIFRRLSYRLSELTNKGTPFFESSIIPHGPISNVRYNSNYAKIASIAKSLTTTLRAARNDFFNNPVSQERVIQFQTICIDAITHAKGEFAKFRGFANWYNELNPVLQSIIQCIRTIAGIIAGLTVIPAIFTEMYTERGYIGTFFSNKTGSLKELERFEQGLVAKEGIFDRLKTEITLELPEFNAFLKP
ncbi:hypothetical protein [Legionella worsleiensis]|uniref:Coiled-coil protein n=1 Tax=Legionella worsleiensis TaxID=45076 RepID=A0A0W1AJG4_9GAMM|nr:hypothetical protein [Legionella worsleiensis]KTD81527.1 coiled-coil protein [Legionella worsleiensis]STY32086.1 coiled-coil protein [Legionella worsleiensis]